MISAAAIVTPCLAKSMSGADKKSLALQAMIGERSIVSIANTANVSRKFISAQRNKLLTVVDEAFSDINDHDDILFQLPVTKNWLKQCVASLALDCRSSFRGIIKAMDNLLDYKISVGGVFNILQSLIQKTQLINSAQNLSAIKTCAQDEIFQHNQPVLTGVDIPSLYCYLLSLNEQRDADTWAIHLLDLQTQGFNPDRVIADDGGGLRAGHKLVFENTPCDADHFHISKCLMELRRFFRNRLKSSISYHHEIQLKVNKAQSNGTENLHMNKLRLAQQNEQSARYLSEAIDTLVSWMEHDVLQLAGYNPSIRLDLFDFIVSELVKLKIIHPHRITAVIMTLKNQRNSLLAFSEVLNEKFMHIANKFSQPLKIIWSMCELQRCEQGGDNYAIRSLPLQCQLGDAYDAIEDSVIKAMSTTERTSSMVENLNSRISPYLFLRKEVGNNYLDLLQFYLNHTPFLRSSDPNRRKRTPTEILTNQTHDHWLEMLDFKRFKRAA